MRADLTEPDGAEAAAAAAPDDSPPSSTWSAASRRVPHARGGDPDEFDRMLRLNLRPAVMLARAAIPRLLERGGGAFVCVSARAALQPVQRRSRLRDRESRACSRSCRALDAEYRADGVRANAILPSVIDTPENRAAQPDADFSRWVPPAEIAAVVRFLVSPSRRPYRAPLFRSTAGPDRRPTQVGSTA